MKAVNLYALERSYHDSQWLREFMKEEGSRKGRLMLASPCANAMRAYRLKRGAVVLAQQRLLNCLCYLQQRSVQPSGFLVLFKIGNRSTPRVPDSHSADIQKVIDAFIHGMLFAEVINHFLHDRVMYQRANVIAHWLELYDVVIKRFHKELHDNYRLQFTDKGGRKGRSGSNVDHIVIYRGKRLEKGDYVSVHMGLDLLNAANSKRRLNGNLAYWASALIGNTPVAWYAHAKDKTLLSHVVAVQNCFAFEAPRKPGALRPNVSNIKQSTAT